MADKPEERPSHEPDKAREKDEDSSWIERIAKRSTGLPDGSRQTEANPSRRSGNPGAKSPWAMAGVGIQFAATAAIFAFIGYYLDNKYGWSPWGLIGFSIVGFVGGLYLLIKQFLMNQDGK